MFFGKAHQFLWSVLMTIISWAKNLNGGGLTPWEEHRARVFENRALRRMFGSKQEEMIGSCRMELNSLYSPPNIITMPKARKMRPEGGGDM
jgi:hypothetical protein